MSIAFQGLTAAALPPASSPVEDAVPVHMIHGLHELVQVCFHPVLCNVVSPPTYELIDVHVLHQASTCQIQGPGLLRYHAHNRLPNAAIY